MILVKAVIVSCLGIHVIILIMLILRKRKLHSNEKKVLAAGIKPSGAALTHGMVLNDDGVSVKGTSHKNSVWYSRLL